MNELTPTERQALKARAHHLHPVVMVGAAGLTPQVLREIDLALGSHELIKIRILGDDRARRKNLVSEICNAMAAQPVQRVGKILVVYRQRPDPESPASPSRHDKHRPKRHFQNS